jgi:metal-dependent hydrolase (beta-lactamase superfamily II)
LTAKSIAWLSQLDIAVIRASHCTGFRALVEIAVKLGGAPMASGEVMHLQG